MKNLIFLTMFAGLLIACNENDILQSEMPEDSKQIILSQEEAISIAYDNPKTLTASEILALVENFSTHNKSTKEKRETVASISKMFHIKFDSGKKTRDSSANIDSIPIYEVKLVTDTTTGYAIVSADERSAGVLAYIEKGNHNKKNETGASMMLDLAEATTISEIMNVEKLKSTLREKTLNKIAKTLGVDSIKYNEIKDLIKIKDEKGETRSPAYDRPLSSIQSYIMPVTKTEWSQNSPYNLLLPQSYDPIFHSLMHYPAGCGVIAAAQTLAVIAPSMNIGDTLAIDWDYLKENTQINWDPYFGGEREKAMMASALIKFIYNETNTTPVIDESYEYGPYEDTTIPCVKSSSTQTTNLLNFLKRYVSCGTFYNKYAPDPLLTTLNLNNSMFVGSKPCVAIMGGVRAATDQTSEKGSHAWVIDGYAICTKTTREILKNFDLYFHANMGWDGTDSGFYKVNADTSIDFETKLGTYNLNMWEITEIHSY